MGSDCGGKREAICVGGCALGDSKGTNKTGGKLAGSATSETGTRPRITDTHTNTEIRELSLYF